jgi:hypothetical protein
LRDERESGWISMIKKKKKSWLKSILTMKTGGFDVNEFLLIKKAYTRCFVFSLKW